ncbi:hypothetical protein AB0L13_22755 [Saccharopolyspora shandongensis]|uniref:hypothetical protein n=1 Tax=Saccharopolyspora shandongensis TaxID=418495 RepID=UPI003440AFEB
MILIREEVEASVGWQEMPAEPLGPGVVDPSTHGMGPRHCLQRRDLSVANTPIPGLVLGAQRAAYRGRAGLMGT